MELITPRLRLREVAPGDLEALYAIYGDPRTRRYEGTAVSLEFMRVELGKTLEQARQQPRKHYKMAITHPPNPVLRGVINLTLNNFAIQEWEIGWSIHFDDWGLGYATEAARRVLGFAFAELNAHRVVAFCHADNRASVRVMGKLGMQQEGRLREVRWLDGRWNDEYLYAILSHEYKGDMP